MSLEISLSLPRTSFNMEINCSFENGSNGIFGPSGAGKTSFFNCIAGLENPEEGSISLFGHILFDSRKKINIPTHKRKIGFVFQDKLLFPHLTVEENIRFGEKPSLKSAVPFGELVELLDISHILKQYPAGISGGEVQRTAVARALFASPAMLLLDEPFNAVDQNLRKNILPYLREVRRLLKIPMLVISHDLPDIQKLTEKIYVMNRGRLYGGATAAELLCSEEAGDMLDISRFVNTLSLERSAKYGEGLYYSALAGKNDVKIISSYSSETPFVLFLSPSDISLSKERQHNTSIQNQVPCIIKKIIIKKVSVYVILDFGPNIVAEISRNAFNSLQLSEGDRLYALFKARSLKM